MPDSEILPAKRPLKALKPGASARTGTGNQNAVKHGLTMGDVLNVLVPGESLTLYEHWERTWSAELVPVGRVEEFLAHRISAAAWRLCRVERLEGSLASDRLRELLEELAAGGSAPAEREQGWSLPDARAYEGLAKLARHESAIERSFFKCLRELEFLQKARRERKPAPAPVGFKPAES
jgi:hypothetical protein